MNIIYPPNVMVVTLFALRNLTKIQWIACGWDHRNARLFGSTKHKVQKHLPQSTEPKLKQ